MFHSWEREQLLMKERQRRAKRFATISAAFAKGSLGFFPLDGCENTLESKLKKSPFKISILGETLPLLPTSPPRFDLVPASF